MLKEWQFVRTYKIICEMFLRTAAKYKTGDRLTSTNGFVYTVERTTVIPIQNQDSLDAEDYRFCVFVVMRQDSRDYSVKYSQRYVGENFTFTTE